MFSRIKSWLAPSTALVPAEETRRQQSTRPPTIDLSKLRYVPLPPAPAAWEAERKQLMLPASDSFEVRDADWSLSPVEKIPQAERPDPAFRLTCPTTDGVFFLDDLGNAKGLGNISSAALRFDSRGTLAARSGFTHDMYRFAAHPLGRAFAVMSRDCTLHAYDEALQPLLRVDFADAQAVKDMQSRFQIPRDKLKNHLRCIALSADARRYLFTVVDEAYCHDTAGAPLWSLRLPTKEGWTENPSRSTFIHTDEEVAKAIALMNLSLPIHPDRVKERYRELLKAWHPDLNRNDSHAGEKVRNLIGAMETLTGIDVTALPAYTGAAYYKELSRHDVTVEGRSMSLSIGMQVGELFAADWIYAAALAADHGAYLAGYSGRVVAVDGQGRGVRVYDIGAVPRSIIDTGDYLYFLTDTRLYVLRGEELHALIDTADGGDLIVTQTGFALFESKRVRWFNENGRYVGSVVTKDPIRRVYHNEADLIIETRQWRTRVSGAPLWQ